MKLQMPVVISVMIIFRSFLPRSSRQIIISEMLVNACILGELNEKTYLRLKEISAGDDEIDKKPFPNSASFAIDLKIFSESKEPLFGNVEILNYGLNQKPVIVESLPFTDGRINLQTSPVNWLKIKARGYQAREQCLFFSDPIFKLTRSLTKKDLTDPEIFKTYRDSITDFSMEIQIQSSLKLA
jgi:hypothetical protein